MIVFGSVSAPAVSDLRTSRTGVANKRAFPSNAFAFCNALLRVLAFLPLYRPCPPLPLLSSAQQRVSLIVGSSARNSLTAPKSRRRVFGVHFLGAPAPLPPYTAHANQTSN